MSDLEERANRLAEVLVERGLVSEAQVELAMADREINDLPLEEVLLARGWIREDVLYDAAPWTRPNTKPAAKPGPAAAKPAPVNKPAEKPAQAQTTPVKKPPSPAPGGGGQSESPLTSNYDENLQSYRELLKKITGRDFD
jgi:cell division septation protein DedD